ncbi:hypothetical protein GCM10009625_10630 [Brachybacterium fresconis]
MHRRDDGAVLLVAQGLHGGGLDAHGASMGSRGERVGHRPEAPDDASATVGITRRAEDTG